MEEELRERVRKLEEAIEVEREKKKGKNMAGIFASSLFVAIALGYSARSLGKLAGEDALIGSFISQINLFLWIGAGISALVAVISIIIIVFKSAKKSL